VVWAMARGRRQGHRTQDTRHLLSKLH
jgi:hypothetical protein